MERLVVLATIFIIVNSSVGWSQSSDFQKNCAAEARMVFQEKRDNADVNPIVSPITAASRRYQSHYSTTFKRCLMLLEETQYVANLFATSVSLIDTSDRQVYAFYLGSSDKDKTGLEGSPNMCELSSLTGKTFCTTRKEFDAFIARFMKN